MAERPDTELIALARAGDKNAFDHLIARYLPMARRIASDMVADEDIARELVQEAMLQAYLSLGHLRDDGRFKNWFYGIVLNVCRSHIRDRKTDSFSLESLAGGLRLEAVPFPDRPPDPQELAEQRELQRRVLEAVNALSPKERAAARLFYYEQLSLQEIASALGVSVVAVKGRLHKARKRLKEQLRPLYPELDQALPKHRRRRKVVKVTIADVVPPQHTGGRGTVVILLDEVGRRALPIWIGWQEAAAIAEGLRQFPVPARPMTYSFMVNLLEAAGATLEEVRIESLREETFYAVAKIRSGDTVREVDARPSDAIALAVRMGSPLYVAEEILEKAGVEAPDGKKPLGKGMDSIVRMREMEVVSVSNPNLMAFVFGEET